MPDATYFARKAQRCRELLKVARVPDVVEQLGLWAAEFDAEAKGRTERRRHEGSALSMMRRGTRGSRS